MSPASRVAPYNADGGDMLKAVGSRLTYANVVATGALFVALGGGAYALSGVPDRGGVFHGCVSRKTGGLRVVASARSCHATRRRHGRVVDPGELAVAWNQKGQPGANGAKGMKGTNGRNGATQVTVRTATGGVAIGGTGAGSHESDAGPQCHRGEHATGGGAGASNENFDTIIDSSPNGNGWIGRVRNTSPNAIDTFTATAYVICASP